MGMMFPSSFMPASFGQELVVDGCVGTATVVLDSNENHPG